MIIGVASVHIKNDRNAFARVVEMVGAIKKLLGIFRVVVFVIKAQIQKRFVDRIAHFAKLG